MKIWFIYIFVEERETGNVHRPTSSLNGNPLFLPESIQIELCPSNESDGCCFTSRGPTIVKFRTIEILSLFSFFIPPKMMSLDNWFEAFGSLGWVKKGISGSRAVKFFRKLFLSDIDRGNARAWSFPEAVAVFRHSFILLTGSWPRAAQKGVTDWRKVAKKQQKQHHCWNAAFLGKLFRGKQCEQKCSPLVGA